MNRRDLIKGLAGLAVAPAVVPAVAVVAPPILVAPAVPGAGDIAIELGQWLGRVKSEKLALAFLHQEPAPLSVEGERVRDLWRGHVEAYENGADHFAGLEGPKP